MKTRLDKLLMERGLAETRSKALGLIMSGSVAVDGRPITKAGTEIPDGAHIEVKQAMPYVSRGGLKLAAALDTFRIDLAGKVAVDVGASTGGFTDVMLQRGAAKVYALDVGHGQLHYRLRGDPRVINIEGVNARTIEPGLIPELCDLATFDVSFISLRLVVPPLLTSLKADAALVALIKPQFEAGRTLVKKGIVRDETVTAEVLASMTTFMSSIGLTVNGLIPSPIKGAKGNQEYLMHLIRGASV